ncbi:DUF934 domain-containing protein [Aquibium microcysteis]|uniref:DUF934 domain-containing protein n=1 Tax=Aquibium microcysteis TaxID=675281 RepID=UPI00165CEFDA|nr:DUF934 domain-containing protein [Aquibium microcysteis]
MTQSTPDAPRLWTPDGFREDTWTHAESAEALEGNAAVILPLPVWQALDADTKAANRDRIGVLLAPGEPLDAIVEALPGLPLVALSFPAFNDGRSFSKAELLRSRHGYTGAVRACGQVLPDQIPHMIRTGFDELEVSHPVALKRLEEGRAGGLPLYYQPAAKGGEAEGKYSWRRKPAE